MPATPKAPTDRKAKGDQFTFTALVVGEDGEKRPKKFTLPPAGLAAPSVDAGISMDAIMYPDDDMAQLRLGLAMLMVSDVDPEVIKAIRAMRSEEMFQLLSGWMDHKATAEDATVGESSGSSI